MIKRRMYGSLLAITMLTCGVQAQASDSYAGIGFGTFNLDYAEPGFSQTGSMGGAYGYAGYNFSKYFGVEARLGSGGSTSTAVIGLPGVTSKIGMGTFVQAFAKPRIKKGRSEVYGLLGITSTNLTFAASGPGGSFSIVGDPVSDMSYGVGYGISLGESFGLTAEYVSVWSNVTSAYPGFNNSNTNINSFNASVNYKF